LKDAGRLFLGKVDSFGKKRRKRKKNNDIITNDTILLT